jgi:hypothetical protein
MSQGSGEVAGEQVQRGEELVGIRSATESGRAVGVCQRVRDAAGRGGQPSCGKGAIASLLDRETK